MTDLESEIRRVLDEQSREAPQPHESRRVIGRTRARQAVTALGGALLAAAIVGSATFGLSAILRSDRQVATDAPLVTTTMNGLSITYPEGWHVIDPDEAGLNGPDVEPAPEFPRIVLALSPVDTGEQFGCPGMVERTTPTFLMTIQEEPLALAGPDTAAWPIELEPMNVGTAESGCYPGWEFLRAGWTAAGRTFEARLGLAPEIDGADREALFAALESMTFEPADGTAAAAIIATGTAGGEEWQLIATDQDGELVLSLEATSASTAAGGFTDAADELHLIDSVLGEAGAAERVVAGAVPSTTSRVEAIGGEWLGTLVVDVVDVPDEIDAAFDAFVVVAPVDIPLDIAAYNGAGDLIGAGHVGTHGAPETSGEPVDTPLQTIDDVSPEHGGAYWGVYLWVGGSADDQAVDTAILAAEDLGFNPSAGAGEIACDQPAAEELGVPTDSLAVAIYFETREDAEAAAAHFDPPPVGIAKVTTFCLD